MGGRGGTGLTRMKMSSETKRRSEGRRWRGVVSGSDASLLNCGGRFFCPRAIPVNIDVDVRTTLFRMSCKAVERGVKGGGVDGVVRGLCVCVSGGRGVHYAQRGSGTSWSAAGGEFNRIPFSRFTVLILFCAPPPYTHTHIPHTSPRFGFLLLQLKAKRERRTLKDQM